MKITKVLMPGSCIESAEDALRVLESGAQAISLGAVLLFRPWRVPELVRFVLGKERREREEGTSIRRVAQ